jgi:hypothetical protein
VLIGQSRLRLEEQRLEEQRPEQTQGQAAFIEIYR